ncbi:PepSY domain-containing protein [Hyphomicrobium album]|nr:PepSY domain-containing protein [Hyphomicrobium album]
MNDLTHAQSFTAPKVRRAGMARRAMKTGKRWLFYTHRWLGVTTCILSVMWFLSGLVMLYVPFPVWNDEQRVASLPAIAPGTVKVLPDEALARSGLTALPSVFRLEMGGAEPVYRLVASGKHVSVSAVSGEPVSDVSEADARRVVGATFGEKIARASVIDYDQWTVTRKYDPYRPLYKLELGDAAATVVYVSSRTGEIVQDTTHFERVWNWLGAIPHWIYFSPIRRDADLWHQVVVWLSGPMIIGAVAGMWIGILRLRPSRAAKGKSMTPHRGWMKWHHLGGLIGGLFLVTWIASGWLSMNPFKLFARTQNTDAQRAAYAGRASPPTLGVTSEALAAAIGTSASELSFAWVGATPIMLARKPGGSALLAASTGSPLALDQTLLVKAAQAAYPADRIAAVDLLTEEDVYWYSHHRKRPLPVLRVQFEDANRTWLIIDPQTGEIAGLSDSSARTYRWLFNFLHDYDLPVLLRNQPARDGIVWLLSIAGLIISVSGVVVGWRTLTRGKFP